MQNLVTVVSVLRWLVAAFFVLTILHPVKADDSSMNAASYARTGSCGSFCITAYCYPPTGRGLK